MITAKKTVIEGSGWYLMKTPNRQMTARDVIEALFPGKNYGTRVPADASAIAEIDGVAVEYLTAADAKEVWGGKRGMYMRARACCPTCGRMVAASRLNQHAKVHR